MGPPLVRIGPVHFQSLESELEPVVACLGGRLLDAGSGTRDTALGRRAGLEVVSVLPVHSLGQTLGWILWEHALEKRGILRLGAAWITAYALTRWSVRTDPSVRRNANTFQAVFRRPGAETKVGQLLG